MHNLYPVKMAGNAKLQWPLSPLSEGTRTTPALLPSAANKVSPDSHFLWAMVISFSIFPPLGGRKNRVRSRHFSPRRPAIWQPAVTWRGAFGIQSCNICISFAFSLRLSMMCIFTHGGGTDRTGRLWVQRVYFANTLKRAIWCAPEPPHPPPTTLEFEDVERERKHEGSFTWETIPLLTNRFG